ncbi:manganese catalase family protein [Candidatus Formimonas warabiya]|uniref:Rubrerythrin family protein n=1 Tax=Formimonas warabiya TaxID=1761012 RepID=A0A3G1KWR2_FORW1|nr:manganese catalase family protein [Candidatus Formimonas warabiya]ATW26860.1 rubrerythrin family protein [Candidatus Formimonas warabiya]
MWIYEKKLEYPVRVSKPNVKLAKFLVTQYGGPDGELSAALQYFNQRYSVSTDKAKGILTDIGTEELAHLEIVATLIHKLIKNASPQEMEAAGLGGWYAQLDHGLFYFDANGVPWSAQYISTLGDEIADLQSDLALERRAQATYEHLIGLTDDPDVIDVLKFLREREIVHFQRFGEVLQFMQEQMQNKEQY